MGPDLAQMGSHLQLGVTVVRIADVLARADRLSPIDHFHPGTVGYAAIARRIADTF